MASECNDRRAFIVIKTPSHQGSMAEVLAAKIHTVRISAAEVDATNFYQHSVFARRPEPLYMLGPDWR
jgi:hypothetical protein